MDKILGILPYIYFEEPVKLGDVKFLSVPDWKQRNLAPHLIQDRHYLQNLSKCFQTTSGLSTNKGARKALTYVLISYKKGKEKQTLEKASKAITLLRYALLRPDSQAMDNIESTYFYVFNLPPVIGDNFEMYRCLPNIRVEQEIWIDPQHHQFPLPNLHVDLQLLHPSQIEDLTAISKQFFKRSLIKNNKEIILAIEWYNQSFLTYSIRDIAGRLVDIATAFETLFQLPKNHKTEAFKKNIRQSLQIKEGSLIDNWAEDFYHKVRSETVHKGKPLFYLFKHPDAQIPHLGFFWSAQRIFRECVSVKMGLPRHIDNDRLIEELIPNEVHLDVLKKAGGFKKIIANNLLGEINKLRRIHPVGKQEDIIWLGKELLKGYKKLYPLELKNLPTLELILSSEDTSSNLGLKYYQFHREFKAIYLDRHIYVDWDNLDEATKKKPKLITLKDIEKLPLESAIYHFSEFAGYALMIPF